MRTNTENSQLFFGALAILIMSSFWVQYSHAAIKPITCETNFGEKSFTIEKHTVAFHNTTKGRSISSVLDSATRKTQMGFKKTIYRNGNKHLINIENERNFDSNNDFLAVTSPKGHKMTYPLNCSLVN